MRKLIVERDHIVTMPEGIRLFTDLYIPESPGPHPTLIYRVRGNKDLSFIRASSVVLPMTDRDSTT